MGLQPCGRQRSSHGHGLCHRAIVQGERTGFQRFPVECRDCDPQWHTALRQPRCPGRWRDLSDHARVTAARPDAGYQHRRAERNPHSARLFPLCACSEQLKWNDSTNLHLRGGPSSGDGERLADGDGDHLRANAGVVDVEWRRGLGGWNFRLYHSEHRTKCWNCFPGSDLHAERYGELYPAERDHHRFG